MEKIEKGLALLLGTFNIGSICGLKMTPDEQRPIDFDLSARR